MNIFILWKLKFSDPQHFRNILEIAPSLRVIMLCTCSRMCKMCIRYLLNEANDQRSHVTSRTSHLYTLSQFVARISRRSCLLLVRSRVASAKPTSMMTTTTKQTRARDRDRLALMLFIKCGGTPLAWLSSVRHSAPISIFYSASGRREYIYRRFCYVCSSSVCC